MPTSVEYNLTKKLTSEMVPIANDLSETGQDFLCREKNMQVVYFDNREIVYLICFYIKIS